jgi:hypothetical protein
MDDLIKQLNEKLDKIEEALNEILKLVQPQDINAEEIYDAVVAVQQKKMHENAQTQI